MVRKRKNGGCNKTVPVEALCFIERDLVNSIEKIEDNGERCGECFIS